MKVIIVGSGIAGLSAAIFSYLEGDEVILATKKKLSDSNSFYAQGGVIYQDEEKNALLLEEDIQKASSFSSKPEAVKYFVEKGPETIEELLFHIAPVAFTRKNGKLSLRREGGHSARRIIHYLDRTGQKIAETLVDYIRKNTSIHILEETFLLDLAIRQEQTIGGFFKSSVKDEEPIYFMNCQKLILASGGIGECYESTTNPPTATGDAIAIAYRAGASVSGMEYTQFHPTVLAVKTPEHQRLLISEAIRGEGAFLVNKDGEDFMKQKHPLASLAPRDFVSRCIYEEMMKSKTDCVYLDATKIDSEILEKHFPHIFNECLKYGVDIRKDPIPVSPGYHFLCGGVDVDLRARTKIGGLYAIGECANSGLHGANRLASASLLECVVSAKSAAGDKPKESSLTKITPTPPQYKLERQLSSQELKRLREYAQKIAWESLSIVRYIPEIAELKFELKQILNSVEAIRGINLSHSELCNIVSTAYLIGEQALQNKKSLGCHYIIDDKKRTSS